ncbi:MAG: endo-1,4-beta-xylanase [Candidatus Sumerlaeota bacterium]|nr:endo-1,4-beta-xylanase [Candidatus Sumerlaeota bacterium]
MTRSLAILLTASFPLAAAGAEGFFDGVDEASRPTMEAARKRIEEIRKGDFVVHFVDGDGKPIETAGPVDIRLVRHAFKFGGNLAAVTQFVKTHPECKNALAVFEELFNLARVGNFWRQMEPKRGGPLQFDSVDADVAWARERGMDIRFHCLIYNYEYSAPTWSKEIRTTEEWWPLIERRIREVAQRYGDTIGEYDVINEMLTNRKWYEANNPIHPPLSDPKVGARIFEIARKYLPKATLVSLEAGIASTAESNKSFQDIFNYQKALVALGAPVDVIGYQAHFYASGMPFQQGHKSAGPNAFTMKSLEEGMDKLATIGKPIHITEFSAPSRSNKVKDSNQPRLSDEEVAAWTVNFYTLAFSKPYIHEITRWFLIDTIGGRGLDAGLLTLDGQKKPAYFALKKLLKEDWTMNWSGELQDGAARFRGFYGTYEARIPNHPPVKFDFPEGGKGEIVVKAPKD